MRMCRCCVCIAALKLLLQHCNHGMLMLSMRVLLFKLLFKPLKEGSLQANLLR
jgi:hypothetical protein